MDDQKISTITEQLFNSLSQFKRAKISAPDKSGLTHAEQHFLWFLAETNDGAGITSTEIANQMGITMAAITHIVNPLEERGLIKRTQSKEDRRVIYIKLTAKGQKVVKTFQANHIARMRDLVKFLGDKDSLKLISLLKKMQNHFQSYKRGA